MKYILSFSFLLWALTSFSQEKKDSKIIVTVSDTTNLFNRLALAFYEKGYSLENKDQQLKVIFTNEKHIDKSARSMKIMALIKDSNIVFSGVQALDIEQKILGTKLERVFEPVLYRRDKGSDFYVCWQEIESIAKQFGTNITFSK
jgi:hypothetical protein